MGELARQIKKHFPKQWLPKRHRWHAALAKELHAIGFDPTTAALSARMALSDARIRFGDPDYHWGKVSIQIFAEELSRYD